MFILKYILVTKDCVALYRLTLSVAFSVQCDSTRDIQCSINDIYNASRSFNAEAKNTFELE